MVRYRTVPINNNNNTKNPIEAPVSGDHRAATPTPRSVHHHRQESSLSSSSASNATGRRGVVEGGRGEEGACRDVCGRRRSAPTHIIFPKISFLTNGSGHEEAEIGTGTEVVESTSSVDNKDEDNNNNEHTTSPTPTPICSDEGNGTTATTALTISSSSSNNEEATASTGRGGGSNQRRNQIK